MSELRSLMLGDCDHYASPYMLGVKQAMQRLGHAHAEVSIRKSARQIENALALFRPSILWTHMLLWPPAGAPPVEDLLAIVEGAKKRGARVVIHDGDAKEKTRHPHGISKWCALALVNHAYPREAWGVPTLKWPYFAATQDAIAPRRAELAHELFFAGTIGGSVYSARTALLEALRKRRVGLHVHDPAVNGNTLADTPVIAASANAVLGFGRPEIPGWCDVRVFQYPGAGGVLLHDDVAGYLEPWVHFVPYHSGDADSVIDALARLRAMSEVERSALRARAFSFVQAHHSSVARVRQVLGALGLA